MSESPAPASPVAVLAGTDRQPEVRLRFPRGARHAASGEDLTDWVKRAPRRRWRPDLGCWVITAFGGTDTTPRDPERVLAKAGFTLDLDPPGLDESLRGTLALTDLVAPLCRRSQAKPGVALVRPRFAGWDVCRALLGHAAQWDRDTQRFEVPLTALLRHGRPKEGLVVDPDTLTAARDALLARPTFDSDRHSDADINAAASHLATATGIDMTGHDHDQVQRLVDVVGDVPDWFGLNLYPYQRLGALAAVAGRNAICDPAGLGKTRQALAALAIRDIDRAVFLVPPVVLSNWAREIEQSGLAVAMPKKSRSKKNPTPDPDPTHRYWVMFKAGRKEPELPERGVVIVADSLVASRPELRDTLSAWGPDALVYDEAHRARNWTSARARAARDLCDRLRPDALRLPLTGTPLFGNPAELASLLAISGHLDYVFGGYDALTERYCRRNNFNALVARKSMLPELKQILAGRVWVRRNKKEVLADLPAKSRHAHYVDVDLSGFRKAHDEVIDTITVWVEQFLADNDCYPDGETVKAYARSQIGLMSPLRKAAGLAKVPIALDYISDWIDNEVAFNADGSFTCDRPLLVWAHHQEVIDALVGHIANHPKEAVRSSVGVIVGGTSASRTRHLVDEFQAGRMPVLVCSITAAGVGITLTRGSDALFLEADWNPSIVSQAEDRQSRIGQTVPTINRFMLAESTLDPHIQRVLGRKAEIIDAVVDGGEAGVNVLDADALDDLTGPTEIVQALVEAAIERHQKGGKKKQQAA